MLDKSQQAILLKIARSSIQSTFDRSVAGLDPAGLDEVLVKPSGAFVTLRGRGGDLRGCIGSIEPVEPLYLAVASNARAAAFRDPRFHPLRPEELARVEIEVSVLGPIERVADPLKEIVVSVHGLIMRRGRYGGLLLPQVPIEQGWDRDTFLEQTCVKAGLDPDAWKDPGTRIEKFAAQVFGEQDI